MTSIHTIETKNHQTTPFFHKLYSVNFGADRRVPLKHTNRERDYLFYIHISKQYCCQSLLICVKYCLKSVTVGCPKCPTLLPRKFVFSCLNVPTFGTFRASKLVGPKLLTKIAFYHYLIFSLDKTHFPSMQTRLTHKTRLFLVDCFALSGVFIEDKNKWHSI